MSDKRKNNVIRLISVLAMATIALAVFPAEEDSIPLFNNPDVNHDGEVNLLDIIIVSRSFGEPVPEPIEDSEIVALRTENSDLIEQITQLTAEIDRLNELLAPPPVPGKVDVLDFQVKITQQNDIFWQFSWNLTLANNTGEAAEVDVDILFLDSDEFIVSSDYEYNLPLAIGESKTFRGTDLIRTEIASEIVEYEVELEW